MSNKYYYLTSSLPYLFFEKPVPISSEDFFSECEKWLSKSEFNMLRNTNFNDLTTSHDDIDIVKEWKRFNNDTKQEIALIRDARKKHTIEKAPADVKEIFDEKNPLLMEKRFEKTRWNFIEQHEFLYSFDINWLVLYLFKLQISERISVFNKEKGRQTFDELSQLLSMGAL